VRFGHRSDLAAPLAVFGLALAVRLAFIALVQPDVNLGNDAGQYDAFARAIASGRGYVTPDGEPTAFWPVGYPAFLAFLYLLFGQSVVVGQLANAFIDACTAVLVLLIGRQWLSYSGGLVAGSAYALFPGAIGFTALTLSETLFTALLAASILVLALNQSSERISRSWILAFAGLVTAATYVRGIGLLLPVIAAAWLAMAARWNVAARFGLAAVALVLLLSLPWAVRNSVRLGGVTYLSTNLGQDLRTGHNPNATGGLDFQEQLAWAFQFTDMPPVEAELAKNRQGLREGLRYALAHPLHEVELSARKVARLYRDDADSLRWVEHYGVHPVFGEKTRKGLYAVFNGYYYLVGAAAAIGLFLGLRERAPWALLALLLVAYWTVVHIVFFAEPRFHAPLLPVLSLLAASAIGRFAAPRGRNGRRRLEAPAGEHLTRPTPPLTLPSA
jgi:4-amino-4-deoxy-L-arabinose transferase-like glycosyltransferase